MSEPPCFLGRRNGSATYASSRGVVVPVPFEHSVSWGRGTARGPEAIIEASNYVEIYDEVLEEVPLEPAGIHTCAEVQFEGGDPVAFLDDLAALARNLFADGKFPVFLGGEHSLTTGPVQAAQETFDDLSVLQLDAHADLRDEYHGTPWSHACVMRRIHEMGVPVVPVGIRSLSPKEARFVEDNEMTVFWSHRTAHGDEWIDGALTALSETVYITFDVDYFDPSVVPSTGTPEPGGASWHDTLRFLARVFAAKRVVGMDCVELAPIKDLHAPNFTVARLVYRCFGYRFHVWP